MCDRQSHWRIDWWIFASPFHINFYSIAWGIGKKRKRIDTRKTIDFRTFRKQKAQSNSGGWANGQNSRSKAPHGRKMSAYLVRQMINSKTVQPYSSSRRRTQIDAHSIRRLRVRALNLYVVHWHFAFLLLHNIEFVLIWIYFSEKYSFDANEVIIKRISRRPKINF